MLKNGAEYISFPCVEHAFAPYHPSKVAHTHDEK